MTAIPDLRPLGIGEVLDRGLKAVWRNARTLATVVVFVVLPIQIVSTLITASAAPSALNVRRFGIGGEQPTISHDDFAAVAVATAAAALLGLFGSVLASGACYRVIASDYIAERTGWRESLRYAFSHLRSILWITVLVSFLSGLATLLCVLPGVYLWVGFAVAIPVLLTEGTRGSHALGRSRELVKGFWWRAFGVLALGYLLTTILGGAINAIILAVTFVEAGSTSPVAIVVSIVAGTLGKLLTTPFVAAFATVLYFDLRVRKEGFDLQLLAQRIGVDGTALPRSPGPPPAGPGSPPPPGGSAAPPFWPPPPGWKPGGDGA